MYQELLLTFSEVDEALKAKALMLAIIIHKRPSIIQSLIIDTNRSFSWIFFPFYLQK